MPECENNATFYELTQNDRSTLGVSVNILCHKLTHGTD